MRPAGGVEKKYRTLHEITTAKKENIVTNKRSRVTETLGDGATKYNSACLIDVRTRLVRWLVDIDQQASNNRTSAAPMCETCVCDIPPPRDEEGKFLGRLMNEWIGRYSRNYYIGGPPPPRGWARRRGTALTCSVLCIVQRNIYCHHYKYYVESSLLLLLLQGEAPHL